MLFGFAIACVLHYRTKLSPTVQLTTVDLVALIYRMCVHCNYVLKIGLALQSTKLIKTTSIRWMFCASLVGFWESSNYVQSYHCCSSTSLRTINSNACICSPSTKYDVASTLVNRKLIITHYEGIIINSLVACSIISILLSIPLWSGGSKPNISLAGCCRHRSSLWFTAI
jgi:hypothetical protein